MSKAKYNLGKPANRSHKTKWLKALLLAVLLIILAGTAYYVKYAQTQALATLNDANRITDSTKPVKTSGLNVQLTDGWSGFSSQDGNFSLKYPSGWVQPPKSSLCPSGLFDRAVYLGPSSVSVLKCGYDVITSGQVTVASFLGDHRQQYGLDPAAYQGISKGTLNVNGVVGQRLLGHVSVKALPASDSILSSFAVAPAQTRAKASFYPALKISTPVRGTLVERYIFYVNNNTYVAEYIQAPKNSGLPSQNLIQYFDLMVRKTMSFSAS
ncbi:MAG TPA: hypothetical protein VFN51_00580 [Candidatus Saccharimonadales bacterium]|nr:hypothetical protein [Candidatus Saccharimonadales bacterium]